MLRIIGINVFISLRELITSILLDVFGGGLRLFAFWRVQPFASPSSQASGRGSANMVFLSLPDVPDRNQIINRQKIYSGGPIVCHAGMFYQLPTTSDENGEDLVVTAL